MIRSFLLTLSLVITLSLFGQNSSLEVKFVGLNRNDTLVLKLSDESASNNEYRIVTKEDSLVLFSGLNPGKYTIQLTTKSNRSYQLYVDYVQLSEGKTERIAITSTDLENFIPEIPTTPYKNTYQTNFQYFYNDHSFIPMNTGMKNTIGFNLFQTLHHPLSKHVAYILNGGCGIQTAKLTTLPKSALNNETLLKHTYSYFKALGGAGIRYSQSNESKLHGKGFEFDLSLNYHLPLFLQEIQFYSNNKRIVNSKLHQFTDFNICLSGGYNVFRIFLNYRLMDYLIGDYIEFPRLQCGIMLTFDKE